MVFTNAAFSSHGTVLESYKLMGGVTENEHRESIQQHKKATLHHVAERLTVARDQLILCHIWIRLSQNFASKKLEKLYDETIFKLSCHTFRVMNGMLFSLYYLIFFLLICNNLFIFLNIFCFTTENVSHLSAANMHLFFFAFIFDHFLTMCWPLKVMLRTISSFISY